jgi:hypothetical protein
MQFASLFEGTGYSPWCDPLNQEAPMQRYQEKSSDVRETGNSIRLIFAGLGAILLVIVTLVTNYPAVSEWISASAQAEFVNPDITSAGPTQIAQPAEPMRIVRSN